ncbi:hypothetical protein SFR_0515 [Streptomyces sp. FR-008]|nr:hypothetical protein SFR_0515 [Streptomyces sp. FR-008]
MLTTRTPGPRAPVPFTGAGARAFPVLRRRTAARG